MPSAPVCGVDIGGTKVLAVSFDPAEAATGEHLARRADTPRDADALLDLIVSMVNASAPTSLSALGVGVAGLVDRSGRLRVGPNLPGVVDLAMRERLSERLEVPVLVENDATTATWGEFRVGGHGADDLTLVTLGTGIGTGMVMGGVLQTGANGFAGEAGHMIINPDGPACVCGRRGCWERYASGSGLGRLGREAARDGLLGGVLAAVGGDLEEIHGRHVGAAAVDGDPEALEVVRGFAWWVALGLANLTNLVDPEVFVIGGGLIGLGDLLLDPVREAFADVLYAHDRRPAIRIEAATLGEDAGAVGAGILAADDVLD
jgi:glucokinase